MVVVVTGTQFIKQSFNRELEVLRCQGVAHELWLVAGRACLCLINDFARTRRASRRHQRKAPLCQPPPQPPLPLSYIRLCVVPLQLFVKLVAIPLI